MGSDWKGIQEYHKMIREGLDPKIIVQHPQKSVNDYASNADEKNSTSINAYSIQKQAEYDGRLKFVASHLQSQEVEFQHNSNKRFNKEPTFDPNEYSNEGLVQSLRDQVAYLTHYKQLCESRILELQPGHPLPIHPDHLGQPNLTIIEHHKEKIQDLMQEHQEEKNYLME